MGKPIPMPALNIGNFPTCPEPDSHLGSGEGQRAGNDNATRLSGHAPCAFSHWTRNSPSTGCDKRVQDYVDSIVCRCSRSFTSLLCSDGCSWGICGNVMIYYSRWFNIHCLPFDVTLWDLSSQALKQKPLSQQLMRRCVVY